MNVMVRECQDGTVGVWLRGQLVARIARTLWGKFKVVGDDVYGKTVDELVQRIVRQPEKWL